MHYHIGSLYEFEVSTAYGDEEDFFRLMVPEYGEVRLPKMKFQRSEPMPDKLLCAVKSLSNNQLVLSHYVPDYVNRFYFDSFKENQFHEYDFKVVGLPQPKNNHYTLEDKYGIQYKLFDEKAFLGKGQKVLCRFDRITPRFFSLRLADNTVLATYYRPFEFLSNIGIRGMRASVLVKLFESSFADARTELDNGSPFWIITVLKGSLPLITEWFINTEFKRRNRFFNFIINTLHRAGLFLLEDSRYMRNLDTARRRSLQSLLTEIIDNIEPLAQAVQIAARGRENDYIENLKQKLGESGYLYHPTRQLAVLMMILRRNPPLVRNYLGGIFDSIMGWKLDTWTTEPFRSAFIGQFEIYIRQASSEINAFPQADTADETDRLEKIITAIALQMLISGDPESAQYRRNRSLLYRYISLQRNSRSNELLDKSFRTLVGAEYPLEFTYDSIKQPQILMTCVCNGLDHEVVADGGVQRYVEGSVELEVSADGCTLRRLDDNNAGRMIPNGMMDWLSPQIYLDGVQSLSGNKISSFDAHRTLWSNIENALYKTASATPIAEQRKLEPEIDEEVCIIISQEPVRKGDNPRWQARIDDENYELRDGYIDLSDIVNYRLNSNLLERSRHIAYTAFIDENGQHRRFMAKVDSIDHDGQIHFSLADEVSDQLTNLMNDIDTYAAVITYINVQDRYTEYLAISETGYSVYLTGTDDYRVGDVVLFKVTDRSTAFHISGSIIEDGDSVCEFGLNNVQAFANLMKGIACEPEYDEEDDTDLMLDTDAVLEREDVMEIVELIRLKAIASTNLLEAFDYLHFGRLLAMLVGDESMGRRLKVHAELLRLHQFYATNNRIDAEELEGLRSQVAGFPFLEMVFHRLEIVSWLGDTDRNPELWETVNLHRNHLETSLAQLVLSYNMLPPQADETVVKGLKKQIAKTLGLTVEMHQLKWYGNENQFTEFKSSLVFPARKKNEKVAADPEAQQQVILKIIASFLNADGGTLYIGVHDKTHCEIGLFEDFNYYRRYNPSDGRFTQKIANVDNLCVFLTNLINNTFGKVVSGSVTVDVDSEATHDVVVVNVKPRTVPVYLNGELYVRRSGTSTRLVGSDIDVFIEERNMLEMRLREELRLANMQTEGAALQLSETSSASNIESVAESVDTDYGETDQAADSNGIATSTWRNNVLHDWEDGYRGVGYLYFNTDDCMQINFEDRSFDYDEKCRLALAFSRDESQRGYLVMIFENRRVLKVPMSEVLEKDADRWLSYYKDSPLKFATIALPGDGLLTYLTDSKNNISRRVLLLNEMPDQHLTSSPEQITQAPGVADIVAYELVAASALGAFEGSFNRDMSNRQIGYVLRAAAGTDRAKELLERDCMQCRPQDFDR